MHQHNALGMDIEAIRDALRDGDSSALQRRRRIALLAGIGAVDFVAISLYQLGVIRHLPDPPGRIFDSDQVNASTKAYALGVPDGPLGLGLYALTMALASAGGSEESGRHRIFDLLLGGAVVAGALGALDYLLDIKSAPAPTVSSAAPCTLPWSRWRRPLSRAAFAS